MRVKIYRKSAPHMAPIVSDPIQHTSEKYAKKILSGLNNSVSSIHIYVDGVSTYIYASDVSYTQLIKDEDES